MLRVSSILRPRVGYQPRACMHHPWARYAIGSNSRGFSTPIGTGPEQKPTPAQANDNSKNEAQAAVLPHFAERTAGGQSQQADGRDLTWDHPVPHPVYDMEIIRQIPQTHHGANGAADRVAIGAVWLLRRGFDFVSRYRGPGGGMTEQAWLNRCLFLETIAGVPGMVGGMTRHLHSLRRMRRDYGWIHTLLEEAENERMHLIIFMNLKQPGPLMRAMVLAAQGVFFNLFFLSYLVSPRTCHRFVGYLEEEAVKTYTGLLADIQQNRLLAHWQTQTAPIVARTYYKLPEQASLADMVLCIRADEANHRDVNHTFAELNQDHDVNPFVRRQAAQDKQPRV